MKVSLQDQIGLLQCHCALDFHFECRKPRVLGQLFKSNVGETAERQGRACMSLSER